MEEIKSKEHGPLSKFINTFIIIFLVNWINQLSTHFIFRNNDIDIYYNIIAIIIYSLCSLILAHTIPWFPIGIKKAKVKRFHYYIVFAAFSLFLISIFSGMMIISVYSIINFKIFEVLIIDFVIIIYYLQFFYRNRKRILNNSFLN